MTWRAISARPWCTVNYRVVADEKAVAAAAAAEAAAAAIADAHAEAGEVLRTSSGLPLNLLLLPLASV